MTWISIFWKNLIENKRNSNSIQSFDLLQMNQLVVEHLVSGWTKVTNSWINRKKRSVVLQIVMINVFNKRLNLFFFPTISYTFWLLNVQCIPHHLKMWNNLHSIEESNKKKKENSNQIKKMGNSSTSIFHLANYIEVLRLCLFFCFVYFTLTIQ